MEYVEIDEARSMAGLRLVLTPGVPGPWGEAAKGLLRVKDISYTPVRQPGMQEDRGPLLEWTRQTSAPVAMYEAERPRAGWSEILFLTERLAPTPRLVPEDPGERALALGLAFEIAGEHGLGWSRRLLMLSGGDASDREGLPWKYGLEDPDAVAGASARVNEILALLASRLRGQRDQGRRFFLGDSLSVVDVYWAAFSNMLVPMPPERCPMPDFLRPIYDASGIEGLPAPDDLLVEHRDFLFDEFLGVPQDF